VAIASQNSSPSPAVEPGIFRRLAKAGFMPDLIPLLPIGANMSPDSKVKPDQTGKVPGAWKENGDWIGFPDWTHHIATPMHVRAWDSWIPEGAGVGIVGRRVGLIDLDCMDEHLAEALDQLAGSMLGLGVCRFGRFPKRGLPFRVIAPIFKQSMIFTKPGHDPQLVETLGLRQHFVLHHTHKSTGQPYTWHPFDLGDIGFNGLVALTPEQINAYLAACIEVAGELGWTFSRETVAGKHEPRIAPPDVRLDLPHNVTYCARVIKDELAANGRPEDQKGTNSDNRAYALCCELLDQALSDEKILELLKEHWAPHFDLEWLETKVKNANNSKQNENGSKYVAPAAETFKAYGEQAQREADANWEDGGDSEFQEGATEAQWPANDDLFDPALDQGEAEPIEFTVDMVPTAIAAYAFDLAPSLGVTPNVPALSMAGCAATALGNLCRVELVPGYCERPSIWAMLITPSGAGKTPSMDKATAALKQVEKRWHIEDAPKYERYRMEATLFPKRKTAFKDQGDRLRPTARP
jgi:hypothetical protein